jgi:hypothetical protein
MLLTLFHAGQRAGNSFSSSSSSSKVQKGKHPSQAQKTGWEGSLMHKTSAADTSHMKYNVRNENGFSYSQVNDQVYSRFEKAGMLGLSYSLVSGLSCSLVSGLSCSLAGTNNHSFSRFTSKVGSKGAQSTNRYASHQLQHIQNKPDRATTGTAAAAAAAAKPTTLHVHGARPGMLLTRMMIIGTRRNMSAVVRVNWRRSRLQHITDTNKHQRNLQPQPLQADVSLWH